MPDDCGIMYQLGKPVMASFAHLLKQQKFPVPGSKVTKRKLGWFFAFCIFPSLGFADINNLKVSVLCLELSAACNKLFPVVMGDVRGYVERQVQPVEGNSELVFASHFLPTDSFITHSDCNENGNRATIQANLNGRMLNQHDDCNYLTGTENCSSTLPKEIAAVNLDGLFRITRKAEKLMSSGINKVSSRCSTKIMEVEPKMYGCLLYTSPSPRDLSTSRMPSSA